MEAVASGAVLSTYQRTRVESVCDRLGLQSLAFLWQVRPSVLLFVRSPWQGPATICSPLD